jgi:predicted nucleic acid-binding protein
MIFQLVYNVFVTFGEHKNIFFEFGSKLFGLALIFIPFSAEKIFTRYNIPELYFPSIQDITVFSFSELKQNTKNVINTINKFSNNISKENIDEIIQDIPRHSSFRYINSGTLTEEYFKIAYKTLTDPYIYIIISNTGSAASEIISVFTNKIYNHASLSFDSELETIISYNGGERIYPPGLNKEMVAYFNKKKDASIMVYKLEISEENKRKIIDKIKEINQDGSAYNLMGLVLKYSFKPNIMFCSQFVYKMLKYAGINYFEEKAEQIKPTDLIELDYYRKLQFAYEIKLNGNE